MIGKLGQMAVVLVAGMVSVPALAQERRERPERPQAERQRAEQAERQRPLAGQREGAMTANFAERLADIEKRVMAMLTDDQKKQAEPLFKQAKEQVTTLQADLAKLEVQRRELMEKAAEQTGKLREELAVLLTPEQRRAFREAMSGAGGAGGPMAGVMERLQGALRQLDLTEAQQQKLMAVRDELQAKAMKLRESAAGDRQAMMEGMRELMQDLRPKLRDILTPEQMEKIGGVLGGGPGGERPRQ